jgi:rfaE bifunctional protein nucleotidyltransferase chain/domain
MERIVEAEKLSVLGAEFAASGKKLVLTNGCFDLLHAGHIRYLEEARRLGDALIVAVNSDASVRELKGPDRPLNGELDRAEVLSALRCVDHVTIFTGKRVTEVIRALQPAIYAKGGDYTVETLDPGERSALEEAGTEIRLLSLVPGRSTTSLLERARKPSGS